MTGIALIIFIWIWASVAIWLGKQLSKLKLCTRLTINATTGEPTTWHRPVKFVLTIFVFLLPLTDEIISYPRYYMMCQDAGEYQFASGMNVKKARGREVYISETYDYIKLFPRFETLLTGNVPQRRNVNKDIGVIVERKSMKYIDATTGELVMTYNWIEPIASFFALRWDSNKIPWVLKRCDSGGTTEGMPSHDFYRDLQLTRIDAPINNSNLKAE